MTRLTPCPQCQRHLRAAETVCPFCEQALPSGFGEAVEPMPTLSGLKRASLFALGDRSNREAAQREGVGSAGVPSANEAIARAGRRTTAVLLGSVLGASLAAAACGSDDDSSSDVMQKQGGEQSAQPTASNPQSGSESPTTPGPAGPGTASSDGRPEPSSVSPSEGTVPGSAEPTQPETSARPTKPRPDATDPGGDLGPGDVPTAVALYGAVIAPIDEGDGAGGAGGMGNDGLDAGATDTTGGQAGIDPEPPQIQPLYGAPAFSEKD